MSFVARVVLSVFARPSARIRYGRDHRDQRAEAWLPKGDGPHPIVVVLHGGWWRAHWARTLLSTRPLCRDLARRGYAAYNVEYRRLGSGGGWPNTFDDVVRALDHLPKADVVMGHSAGGQLALFAAAERPVANVVALAAPSNLEATSEPQVHRLMGGRPADVPDRYARGNPIRRVPLGARVLLVHGSLDTIVSPQRSRTLAAAAREAGDDVTLLEPECDHRAPIDPRSEAWAATVRWLDDALRGP